MTDSTITRPLYRVQVLTPMENWEDWFHPCAGSFLVWDDKQKAVEAASDLLKWGRLCDGTRWFFAIRVIDATIADGVTRIVHEVTR